MDVNQLRERILELSHDEATPDTGLKEKALVWLNHAYIELMDEIQPYLQDELMQEQTIATNSSGQVALAFDVQRMVRVVDATNSRTLEQASLADMVDREPLLDATGSPAYYWFQGSTLQVYPKAAVTLTVRYLPYLTELVTDGTEETILLPKVYHHALVWGGLVWATMYERSFSTNGDLLLFQKKWEEAKRRVKLSLVSKPDKIVRTQAAEAL